MNEGEDDLMMISSESSIIISIIFVIVLSSGKKIEIERRKVANSMETEDVETYLSSSCRRVIVCYPHSSSAYLVGYDKEATKMAYHIW